MRKMPRLNLALQGGGAAGAFTWGVLDRLLDEEHLHLDRISGTSAGALNAAALVTGLARGGRQGAKDHLAMLWNNVAREGLLMTFLMSPLRKPGWGIWDDAMPLLSPYQVNPCGHAPLRRILSSVVDEALLRQPGDAPRLFVNAVHVRSGNARVFRPAEMSVDALLASACAPMSFPAVEIDGEPYWDGSYASNPVLWPLYEQNLDCDIFMVELTPLYRPETPRSPRNILNRINEIASMTALLSELRALDAINTNVPGASVRMHVLNMSEGPMGAFESEPSIKRTVGRLLFETLRDDGRRACDAWLREHGEQLGRRSTADIRLRYLAPELPMGSDQVLLPELSAP